MQGSIPNTQKNTHTHTQKKKRRRRKNKKQLQQQNKPKAKAPPRPPHLQLLEAPAGGTAGPVAARPLAVRTPLAPGVRMHWNLGSSQSFSLCYPCPRPHELRHSRVKGPHISGLGLLGYGYSSYATLTFNFGECAPCRTSESFMRAMDMVTYQDPSHCQSSRNPKGSLTRLHALHGLSFGIHPKDTGLWMVQPQIQTSCCFRSWTIISHGCGGWVSWEIDGSTTRLGFRYAIYVQICPCQQNGWIVDWLIASGSWGALHAMLGGGNSWQRRWKVMEIHDSLGQL